MERSSEIEGLVRSWFAAASRGDPSLVLAHVSPGDGTRLIGSAPEELFNGGAAVSAFLLGEVSSAGGNATFRPSNVEGFCDGSVGWATAHIRITLPDGKHVSPRWSAVFLRDGDTWQFVQIHASIGIDNDKVGWVYPNE
jgi:ketosteroid isomerase-like protein